MRTSKIVLKITFLTAFHGIIGTLTVQVRPGPRHRTAKEKGTKNNNGGLAP